MPPSNRNAPRRAGSSESSYSVMEFMRDFPNDEACLDWLWRSLYSSDGKEAHCPKCRQTRPFHRIKSRPSYSCARCGHHIHPTSGTIFHKSSTSLHLWFYAIFLMSSTRCGISAKQLEREIGVTYKCAWRMFNKIRTLLREDAENVLPLSGRVEMDETWVGGKLRYAGGQWRNSPNKKPVFGMVERGGRVVAMTVANVDKAHLYPHIQKHVLSSATIYTDEANYYTELGKRGYDHKRIQHALEIYVAGDVHTNTIEGFWSLLKRGISGVYHSVSAKYLQEYLNEYAYRYNHREDVKPMFLGLLDRIERPRRVDRFGFPLVEGSPS